MHILIFHMNSDINVHLSRFISYGRKSTKRGEDGKGKKVFVVEHCHRAKREKKNQIQKYVRICKYIHYLLSIFDIQYIIQLQKAVEIGAN